MKLGRLPRICLPGVPHLSALLAAIRRELSPPPPAVDYTAVLPTNLGMYRNDQLGDCTCAALYHAVQVWTANANPPMDTEPEVNAVLLYEQACGYVPGNPNTDAGGIEQDVLKFAVNTGIPTGASGAGRHKLSAFIEVDPQNVDDVKRCIDWCGLVYIGFNVPAYLPEAPGSVWDLDPAGDQTIQGGHCVILAGYDADGATVISWGAKYRMTWGFFRAFTDESYAIADADWIAATGKSPAGLSMADLEAQMQALKALP